MPQLGSVAADAGEQGHELNQWKYQQSPQTCTDVNRVGQGAQVKHEGDFSQHQCHSKNFLNQFILRELSGARAAYQRVAMISSFKAEALPS